MCKPWTEFLLWTSRGSNAGVETRTCATRQVLAILEVGCTGCAFLVQEMVGLSEISAPAWGKYGGFYAGCLVPVAMRSVLFGMPLN